MVKHSSFTCCCRSTGHQSPHNYWRCHVSSGPLSAYNTSLFVRWHVNWYLLLGGYWSFSCNKAITRWTVGTFFNKCWAIMSSYYNNVYTNCWYETFGLSVFVYICFSTMFRDNKSGQTNEWGKLVSSKTIWFFSGWYNWSIWNWQPNNSYRTIK